MIIHPVGGPRRWHHRRGNGGDRRVDADRRVRPVTKNADDHVVAGSVATDASLRVRVAESARRPPSPRLNDSSRRRRSCKPGAQLLADRAAGWLFYLALAAAAITAIVWIVLLPGDPNFVLERVVTVLIIACPHALGLCDPAGRADLNSNRRPQRTAGARQRLRSRTPDGSMSSSSTRPARSPRASTS